MQATSTVLVWEDHLNLPKKHLRVCDRPEIWAESFSTSKAVNARSWQLACGLVAA